MILFKKTETIAAYLFKQKKSGHTIGFVPTMGALHAGHLSLVAASKSENDITVCSIFINPTQFTNADDFKHYPVTLDVDAIKLLESGCDILFLPSEDEIYSKAHTPTHYNLGALETVLEGQYRPGHFQGVCQVVDRLLNIVQPTALYLGQKDYQQCMVIARLIELIRKNDEVRLAVIPTIRDEDGLAMSSRNLRLNTEQRTRATSIYKSLLYASEHITSLPISGITDKAKSSLEAKGFAVDYFEIRDGDTLLPLTAQSTHLVALVAAHLDGIRLIDNILLS